MPLSLEIQTYTEKSCDNLFLEDMTGLYVAGTNPGGYGAPNPTINDITKVNVVVNYTALEASTEFIFDVALGVITDANFILDGGVPINIYSLMDSYDWPFTSTNPLNLTTDLWTSTIPLFEDMVYTVDYSVTYTPGVSPVVVTTQNLLLVDCKTCCCVSKKTLSIDMNDTDTMVALLIPTAYLQAAQFAADNGLVDTANTFIAKAKKLCDQSKCGCGC